MGTPDHGRLSSSARRRVGGLALGARGTPRLASRRCVDDRLTEWARSLADRGRITVLPGHGPGHRARDRRLSAEIVGVLRAGGIAPLSERVVGADDRRELPPGGAAKGALPGSGSRNSAATSDEPTTPADMRRRLWRSYVAASHVSRGARRPDPRPRSSDIARPRRPVTLEAHPRARTLAGCGARRRSASQDTSSRKPSPRIPCTVPVPSPHDSAMPGAPSQ